MHHGLSLWMIATGLFVLSSATSAPFGFVTRMSMSVIEPSAIAKYR